MLYVWVYCRQPGGVLDVLLIRFLAFFSQRGRLIRFVFCF